MQTVELTKAEKEILDMIREERPFEEIRISKDKGGKANTYFVIRTQKVILSDD
jgi:hypothetical protein